MAGPLARLLTKTLHHLAYGLFEDVLGSLIFLIESLQNLSKSLEILDIPFKPLVKHESLLLP